MRGGDFADQGQAESVVSSPVGAAAVGGGEAVEQSGCEVGVDARAVVADFQHDVPAGLVHGKPYLAVGVTGGVVDQRGEGSAQRDR